jgi:hypothetical protein
MVQQRTDVRHTETRENGLPREAVQFKEVAELPPNSYDLQRVSKPKLRLTSRSG